MVTLGIKPREFGSRVKFKNLNKWRNNGLQVRGGEHQR